MNFESQNFHCLNTFLKKRRHLLWRTIYCLQLSPTAQLQTSLSFFLPVTAHDHVNLISKDLTQLHKKQTFCSAMPPNRQAGENEQWKALGWATSVRVHVCERQLNRQPFPAARSLSAGEWLNKLCFHRSGMRTLKNQHSCFSCCKRFCQWKPIG